MERVYCVWIYVCMCGGWEWVLALNVHCTGPLLCTCMLICVLFVCVYFYYALIYYSLKIYTVWLIAYSVSLWDLMTMLMMMLLEEWKMYGLIVLWKKWTLNLMYVGLQLFVIDSVLLWSIIIVYDSLISTSVTSQNQCLIFWVLWWEGLRPATMMSTLFWKEGATIWTKIILFHNLVRNMWSNLRL